MKVCLKLTFLAFVVSIILSILSTVYNHGNLSTFLGKIGFYMGDFLILLVSAIFLVGIFSILGLILDWLLAD